MKSVQSLVKQFKLDLFDETDIELDFREYQFINNHYGNYPCFAYDDAKTVIEFLYSWAHEYIKEYKANYPNFGGWVYNLQMSVEELRTTKLKHVIERVCEDLVNNFVN
jgi:hypothetical protein